jgi:hypothetical protein
MTTIGNAFRNSTVFLLAVSGLAIAQTPRLVASFDFNEAVSIAQGRPPVQPGATMQSSEIFLTFEFITP